MTSRSRSRSYAWALHSELSDTPNRLSEPAWQGLEYARELAQQAPLRSRQALCNQPLPLLEPLGERQLAAQEGISLAVLRTRIARARAELFGSLSDSGIYKRNTRRRLQRARAFKGRRCSQPNCQADLPGWARSNRRYCDLHASPRARTQRHRTTRNQPPSAPASSAMRSDYTYELRDQAGTILSTGRLTLDERPAPGSTIQLRSTRAFVLDVQTYPDTPHLQLEPL